MVPTNVADSQKEDRCSAHHASLPALCLCVALNCNNTTCFHHAACRAER